MKQLPRAYWWLVAVTVLPLPLALVGGDDVSLSVPSLALTVALLWRIARRSRIAWTLFLVWTALSVAAVAATVGAGPYGLVVLAFVLTSIASIGLLLARSMREHVWLRGRPDPGGFPHPRTSNG